MTVRQGIARGVLGLLAAATVVGLLAWKCHVTYPWYDHSHYHWMPALWVLFIYVGCFVAACALVLAIVLIIAWCWHNR